MLIDTHAHLNLTPFDGDRESVVRRAKEAGVEMIVDVGTDLETSRKAIQNSQLIEGVCAAVGIHPHDSVKAGKKDLDKIEKWLDDPEVIAVGEIGLDYHYDFSPPEIQQELFSKQLLMAQEKGFPVIIHMREAMQDGLETIDRSGKAPWKGVFHCYGGTVEEVHTVIERGFFVSFTGVVTFPNFKNIEKIRAVPLERLLLETDAPYMAPVPHRGKRNEPGFLIHTASALAAIYGIDYETLAEVTTANARRLFGLEN
ncbi:TatD family hydrolase [bacterium]|nr:TatD family hydrolase [bacterium]